MITFLFFYLFIKSQVIIAKNSLNSDTFSLFFYSLSKIRSNEAILFYPAVEMFPLCMSTYSSRT